MRGQTGALGSVTLVTVMLTSFTLHAAGNENRVAAEALFEQGRSLMETARYSEACAKFEASQAMDAGIGTLLYLGDCYERSGRLASAWATFREAESLARVHEQKERAQIARARAAALEPKMAKIVVKVPPDSRVEGLSVRLGKTEVPKASWGIPLPVDPGAQQVEARAPGRRSWQATVHVPEGDSLRYAVMIPKLESTQQAAAMDKNNPGDPGATLRTAGVITGAVGIAGLGAGAVFAALASRKNDESRDECPSQANLCSEEGVELREQAGDYADAATASFAAGGGLLLTGFVLYLAAPSQRRGEGTSVSLVPKLDRKTAVNLTPLVDGRSLGVKLRGFW